MLKWCNWKWFCCYIFDFSKRVSAVNCFSGLRNGVNNISESFISKLFWGLASRAPYRVAPLAHATRRTAGKMFASGTFRKKNRHLSKTPTLHVCCWQAVPNTSLVRPSVVLERVWHVFIQNYMLTLESIHPLVNNCLFFDSSFQRTMTWKWLCRNTLWNMKRAWTLCWFKRWRDLTSKFSRSNWSRALTSWCIHYFLLVFFLVFFSGWCQ